MLLDLLVLVARLHTVTVFFSTTCYKKMQLDTLPVSLRCGAAMRKEYSNMFSFYNDFIHRLHKGAKNHINVRCTRVEQDKIVTLTTLLLQKGLRFKLDVWENNVDFSNIDYYGHHDLIYLIRKLGFTVVVWERVYGYTALRSLLA